MERIENPDIQSKSGRFDFKKFSVFQDKCAMKVGTDGILLGAWTEVRQKDNILDVGAGTGLLALMLAQREPGISIDAIEIDRNAYDQAAANIAASSWANRIRIYHSPLQEFQPSRPYDQIICNPPFYLHSPETRNKARNIARTTETLSPSDLLRHARRLLLTGGQLSVIYPAGEGEYFLKLANHDGWFLKRIAEVRTLATKPVLRYLLTLTRNSEMVPASEEIVIQASNKANDYSVEYRRLTGSFYL